MEAREPLAADASSGRGGWWRRGHGRGDGASGVALEAVSAEAPSSSAESYGSDMNVAAAAEDGDDQAKPYSVRYEVNYFFGKGIALGLSSLLNWGIPPLVAMVFAGHTVNSAQLQASMGYGRVWYNCTALMPCCGMFAYCSNVVPGCIGAKRSDRIPRYLQRGILLSLLLLCPLFLLQLFADPIMRSFGVPEVNARDVGSYCRLMTITCALTVLDGNIEITFVNMGYARCAMFNSAICGIGLDIVATYAFIYQFGWGMEGAALAQMMVKFGRVLVWIALACYFGLGRKLFIASPGSEKLFTLWELRTFGKLAAPQILGNFAGWFVFELQVMALANVKGISQDALAAGAIWVQVESSLAAAQNGWISTTSMRSLMLLGKQDPGARKAFFLFSFMASVVVAISNVLLLLLQGPVCRMVSNDEAVREWLMKILWILTIHTQTRILSCNVSFLFVPLEKGCFWNSWTFFAFYLLASPFAGWVALTDHVTSSVTVKMTACVGATSIAQFWLFVVGFVYVSRLDWQAAGAIINRRANNDRIAVSDEQELDVSLIQVPLGAAPAPLKDVVDV